MKSNMTGIKKIALLIRAIGYDEVLQLIQGLNLSEKILKEIDSEIPDTLSKTEALFVLKEFNTSAKKIVGGKKESLIDALDDFNSEVGSLGKTSRKLNGFKKLSSMSAEKIYNVIKVEQPLHQSIIIFELPEQLSSDVFNLFDIDEQVQITMEADKSVLPNSEILHAINQELEITLSNESNKPSSNIDKVTSFAAGMEDEQLEEYLLKLPDSISDKIRANALTFAIITEQLIDVISEILSNVSTNDIAYAFCSSSPEVIEKMKNALTKTKAQDVSFTIEKSVNASDKKAILSAQKSIISEAKRLQSDGTILIIR